MNISYEYYIDTFIVMNVLPQLSRGPLRPLLCSDRWLRCFGNCVWTGEKWVKPNARVAYFEVQCFLGEHSVINDAICAQSFDEMSTAFMIVTLPYTVVFVLSLCFVLFSICTAVTMTSLQQVLWKKKKSNKHFLKSCSSGNVFKRFSST